MRKKIMFLAFLIVVLLGCTSKNVKKAKEFIDLKMYKEAISLLELEVLSDPKSTDVNLMLGECYLAIDDTSKSNEIFNRLLIIDSDLKPTIGYIYYKKSRYCDSIANIGLAKKYAKLSYMNNPTHKTYYENILKKYAPPTDGLMGYWPFNGNGNDESGKGSNMTVTGAILTTDRFEKANCAYDFHGENSYMKFNVNNFEGLYSPLTLSVWAKLKTNTVQPQNIIALGNILSRNSTQFGFRNGNVCAWRYGGIPLVKHRLASINIWHHYVYSFDGINHKLYINNVQVATTKAKTDRAVPKVGWIGMWNMNEFFNGQIDDIRIYNRSLSTSEISQLYYEMD